MELFERSHNNCYNLLDIALLCYKRESLGFPTLPTIADN